MNTLTAVGSDADRLTVSVAMCTYNGAKYLLQQLESIGLQTKQPYEVVICDDGSVDHTAAIVTEFARKAPFPVRFERNVDKLGPAANFAKAIQLCRGSITVLSDQDDIWRPAKLERLIDVFDHHPDALYVFSDGEMMDEESKLLGYTLWEAIEFGSKPEQFQGTAQLKVLLERNIVTGAGMAFRSSFRDLILPIPVGWMHDHWIALLGSSIGYGVPITESLFQYRRHTAQVCGLRKRTYFQDILNSMRAKDVGPSRRLDEFEHLVTRVQSGSRGVIPADRLRLLNNKRIFLRARARIRSSNIFGRAVLILIEVLTGRYAHFSGSPWSSAFRDLLR